MVGGEQSGCTKLIWERPLAGAALSWAQPDV